MKKVVIDPSIAAVVDINPVFFNEDLNIYFQANEPLSGMYEVKMFNSFQKNTVKVIAINPLTVMGNLMTLRLAPRIQGIGVDSLYYEIWHVTSNRLYFKGNITIVK